MQALAKRLGEATGDYTAAGGSWFEVFDVPMTAHFLGGATIGSSPERGVVDGYHRVWGYPGISVVDGSAVSANLGVNPALTITAQAERAMSLWPNRGDADPRPTQGAAVCRAGAGPALVAPRCRSGSRCGSSRWCRPRRWPARGAACPSVAATSAARCRWPVRRWADERVTPRRSSAVGTSGEWSFSAPVWRWREGSWRFVTVPEDVSDEVDEAVGDATGGFGAVRVEVTVGGRSGAPRCSRRPRPAPTCCRSRRRCGWPRASMTTPRPR